jgi:serine/threonine-protein kinase
MPPLARKLLRLLGLLAYAMVLLAVFVASGYGSFNLFVRSGATRVPDVAGLSREDARGRLTDSGLELELPAGGGRYDPEVPAGRVVEQSPAPSTLVKRGSAVTAVLSLGPQRLQVPELAGKSLQSAQVTLAASSLALGRTLRVYEPRSTPGMVVAQEPSAGALVAPAETVDLFLAQAGSAERFIMPDLVYRDYEEVRRFFEHAGLRLGRVTFEIYEGTREGTILRQFPLAGHAVTRGDAVALVVATGDAGDDLAAGTFAVPAQPAGQGGP